MTARILPNELDHAVDFVFKSKKRLEWIVQENPELQAELNKLPETGEELSSKVVNKVLARIKDL
ncbi:MAG TPA: hypothetical protein ENF27_00745 [Chloroflexi bacterium]|nr:MAG: hypothetical protein DRI65_11990 [Chloroflexota bacterium]HDN04447.1 hypothetical protein [Chloroflexota bacterium]